MLVLADLNVRPLTVYIFSNKNQVFLASVLWLKGHADQNNR